MLNIIKSYWTSIDGNFGSFGAITGLILAMGAGLTLDSSISYNLKNNLQVELDGAVLNALNLEESQYNRLAETIFDSPQLAGKFTNTNATIIRNGDIIEGTASGRYQTLFGSLFERNFVNLSVRSKSKLTDIVEDAGDGRACIIALGTGDNSLVLNSNSTINLPECDIQVHSTSSNPLTYDSNVDFDATRLCLAGPSIGNNNGGLSPDRFETGCDVTPDPFAGAFPAFDASSCDFNNFQVHTLGTGANRSSLTPGVYCGGVNFNSNGGTYNLLPGTYVIKNGDWNIGSGNELVGDGVTIYLEDSSIFNLNSNSSARFSAPTSGPYENFVITERPGLTNSNNFTFSSNSNASLSGLIYLPSRTVIMNSGSNSLSAGIIADKVIVNSGARLDIQPEDFFPPVIQTNEAGEIETITRNVVRLIE